ncbi:MAG TPA: hypothetical protein VMV96_03655 [Acidimicrobiales bacterium]|nr:hypothetical protein [Acidimicrobiales bacterium]
MVFDHDTYSPRRTLRLVTWRLGTLALAGVLLASCSSTASVNGSTPVTGVPSIGISVPLQQVACTLDNSCVAVGATGASLGPSTVGEYRLGSGRWVSLVVPTAVSAQITTASCWTTGCLLAGAQSTGDLLWSYQSATHSVTVLTPPTGGVDVIALDCYATLSCVLLDLDAAGQARILATLDGGVSWTSPTNLDWASGDSVTSLACHSGNDCLVGATTTTNQAVVEVTHDAGFTWTALTTPSAWTSLSSLTCRVRSCAGIAATANGSRLVHTTTFGRVWHGVAIPAQNAALACSGLQHCVAVGTSSPGSPWLAQVAHGVVTARTLKYVPSPLVDVACGTTTCAAIGVTTLLTLTP